MQDGLNQAYIFIVSHTTTIVDFCTDVVQHLIWHFVEVLNEDLKLATRHHQIFVGEGVGNVPADGSKFTSVLNDSVEEAESEKKLLVRLGLSATSEHIFIKCFVASKYVLLQAGWGF